MKKTYKKTPSPSQQKTAALYELNQTKKNLRKIKFWFGKSGYNPTTYLRIWKLLKKLPYEDIPKYKEGFFYFDYQKSSKPINYPVSSMKKDYKSFIKTKLLHPKEITKDCNIPYFQCLYWIWVDMKVIQKFISDKLFSIEGEISSLILNW